MFNCAYTKDFESDDWIGFNDSRAHTIPPEKCIRILPNHQYQQQQIKSLLSLSKYEVLWSFTSLRKTKEGKNKQVEQYNNFMW